MSELVTIPSVTANTPVEIYYCNSMSASCVYVTTATTFPYSFTVPDPLDYGDFVVKIIDSEGCEIGYTLNITPTPTNSPTQTLTPTPTITQTLTPTMTQTSTVTPTPTLTPTLTPTNTTTPTATPVVAYHAIGDTLSVSSANTCTDTVTVVNYYTYISQANLVPVIGATIYQTLVSGVLYNPYNGGDRYLKMGWGVDYYVVQINTSGNIMSYELCP
jgi:hypothetical protein